MKTIERTWMAEEFDHDIEYPFNSAFYLVSRELAKVYVGTSKYDRLIKEALYESTTTSSKTKL